MSDQNIFLITSLLKEGVALRIYSYGCFAPLAGRSFNSGIRILFFQGMGSKWCYQVNTAGFFFPTIFHRAPVWTHQFVICFSVSLLWLFLCFLGTPSPPWMGLKAVSSLADSSGTLVVLKISLLADPENQRGKSVQVWQSRVKMFSSLSNAVPVTS